MHQVGFIYKIIQGFSVNKTSKIVSMTLIMMKCVTRSHRKCITCMGLHSNTVKRNFTEVSEQLTVRNAGPYFKMLTETELIILNLYIWDVNYCKEIMMMLMTTTMIIEFAFRNYKIKACVENNTTAPNQNITDYFTPKLRWIHLVKLNNL